MTACGGNEIPTDGATLAPIQTTAAVTVTVVSATTLPAYYRVQRGNTLTEIAASYGIPVAAIMQLNGLTNPDDIFAGQILAIPPETSSPPCSHPPSPVRPPRRSRRRCRWRRRRPPRPPSPDGDRRAL